MVLLAAKGQRYLFVYTICLMRIITLILCLFSVFLAPKMGFNHWHTLTNTEEHLLCDLCYWPAAHVPNLIIFTLLCRPPASYPREARSRKIRMAEKRRKIETDREAYEEQPAAALPSE